MWSLQQSTQQELLYLVEVTLGTQVSTDPFVYRQSTVAPRFTVPLHCRHSAVFNDFLLDWSPVFTMWLTHAQPSLPCLASSFGKSSSVKVKRYSHLPPLALPPLVSRNESSFNCPLHLSSTASLRPVTPSGVVVHTENRPSNGKNSSATLFEEFETQMQRHTNLSHTCICTTAMVRDRPDPSDGTTCDSL